jgi:DNA polymerase I-like protein with 3'-5' exonuclease and polymerase domains
LIPVEPGALFVSADFPQIEAWIAAVVSEDKALKDYLARGDLHRQIGADTFRIPAVEVSAEQRVAIKRIVYAQFYRQSVPALAAEMGVSETEARELQARVMSYCPGFARWVAHQEDAARRDEDSAIVLPSGRRRELPRGRECFWDRATARINGVIQGTCADLLKFSLLHAQPAAREHGAVAVLPVHDEIIYEVTPDKAASLEQSLAASLQQSAERFLAIRPGAKTKIGGDLSFSPIGAAEALPASMDRGEMTASVELRALRTRG